MIIAFVYHCVNEHKRVLVCTRVYACTHTHTLTNAHIHTYAHKRI